MTGRILTCSLGEYFRDSDSAVPRLSQSIAHTLITQSPLHAWTEHPRLGNQRPKATKAMDSGSLIHKLVLGEGADVEIVYADNYRTKAAQETRDRAVEQHRMPVLEKDWAELQTAVDKIKYNLLKCGIELTGESEVKIEWTEPNDGKPVLCRGMFDHLLRDRGKIYDVKKTQSAHPRNCARSVVNYGYALQSAAYSSALAQLEPEFEGRVDFQFLFIEVEPPYAVLPCKLDGVLTTLGVQQWERAVRTWEVCLRNNDWPGYARGVETLEGPAWLVAQEMME